MAEKDIVSKEVLQHLAADIANILLHLDVEQDSVELLQTEQQRVEMRRADMIARMRRRQTGEKFILHIEIQNANDHSMPIRMLRYLTDILLQYPNEPVYQYLVYIGQRGLGMQHQLLLPNLDYRYHVLDMYTVDCSLLLAQDTPEALVLAILCDFKQRPVQEVVNYIVMRLRELTGDDEKAFRNYYEMLETLADNRNLQANLDEAKHMLTQVDITRFSTYRWGFEKGIERGIEQGIEQARGELQPLLDTEKQRLLQGVKQLIQMNTMSHQAIADLFQLSLTEVEQIAASITPTQH
ncbi:hypothetical protein [Thiofilum flexile]|uniref:hypothetical protein n=1 Tax=Thiofilum flexile TaxID=125627 RepID=UPI00035DF7C5|nr:hypothetical protein [Thiofilum flexile]